MTHDSTLCKDYRTGILAVGRIVPYRGNMKTIDHQLRGAVAATVRAEMARRHLTQSDVADAIGVPRTGVSRRLTGQTPFDVDELAALADLFDMTPGDIMSVAWAAVRGTPCLCDSPEPDSADTADAARVRHPTGLASLLAEVDRIDRQDRRRSAANPVAAA